MYSYRRGYKWNEDTKQVEKHEDIAWQLQIFCDVHLCPGSMLLNYTPETQSLFDMRSANNIATHRPYGLDSDIYCPFCGVYTGDGLFTHAKECPSVYP